MLCATWNVNGIRARVPRLEHFLSEVRPDILLLQETKCSADQFPHEAVEAAGYTAADHSGGRWCGVAILTPVGSAVEGVSRGLPEEPSPDEARWIEAEIGGMTVVSVYVPNGREVDSVHYLEKLEFLEIAARRIATLANRGPLIVGGDMNVAPRDSDVWDIGEFMSSTHVTAAEREALAAARAAGGLVDAHDTVHGEADSQFTWWDYRGGSFHRGLGMRIDHILLSDDLGQRASSCSIARDFRKGEKPSDHVPLIVGID